MRPPLFPDGLWLVNRRLWIMVLSPFALRMSSMPTGQIPSARSEIQLDGIATWNPTARKTLRHATSGELHKARLKGFHGWRVRPPLEPWGFTDRRTRLRLCADERTSLGQRHGRAPTPAPETVQGQPAAERRECRKIRRRSVSGHQAGGEHGPEDCRGAIEQQQRTTGRDHLRGLEPVVDVR